MHRGVPIGLTVALNRFFWMFCVDVDFFLLCALLTRHSVGAPEPTAPEAEAAAPTMDTTAPTSGAPAPDVPAPEAQKPAPANGGNLGVPRPKAVEITSVPQTPLNNQTPVGGSPRPELKIEEEPKEPAEKEEPNVILGVNEPEPVPAVSAPQADVSVTDTPAEAATNGDSKPAAGDTATAAAGEKRKLDEPAAETKEVATNGDARPVEDADNSADVEERTGKKARVEDVEDEPTADDGADDKSAKTKKDKKVALPVSAGKTARKTRSQGPVETAQV